MLRSSTPDQEESTLRLRRRNLLILVLAGIALAAVVSVTYFADYSRNNNKLALPAGCAKPVDGFLVIASSAGFNDSISHGAPDKQWPVITVHQGQSVTIVVCNIDLTAHGFQVTHYYDSSIVTLAPGQVLKVSFVADRAGTFEIYCSVFCPIHIYMQNGMLDVTP